MLLCASLASWDNTGVFITNVGVPSTLFFHLTTSFYYVSHSAEKNWQLTRSGNFFILNFSHDTPLQYTIGLVCANKKVYSFHSHDIFVWKFKEKRKWGRDLFCVFCFPPISCWFVLKTLLTNIIFCWNKFSICYYFVHIL